MRKCLPIITRRPQHAFTAMSSMLDQFRPLLAVGGDQYAVAQQLCPIVVQASPDFVPLGNRAASGAPLAVRMDRESDTEPDDMSDGPTSPPGEFPGSQPGIGLPMRHDGYSPSLAPQEPLQFTYAKTAEGFKRQRAESQAVFREAPPPRDTS